jgi:hypothetical protein
MKLENHHASVSLIGESAGGNLVTMVALLLSNPKSMAQFCKEYNMPEVAEWDYPIVSSGKFIFLSIGLGNNL